MISGVIIAIKVRGVTSATWKRQPVCHVVTDFDQQAERSLRQRFTDNEFRWRSIDWLVDKVIGI